MDQLTDTIVTLRKEKFDVVNDKVVKPLGREAVEEAVSRATEAAEVPEEEKES